MHSLRRIFKYVWPQWPRIIFIVISALIVAALLSLSFMTVIPLLKVMMGQEGLHGWVDRKVCAHRYGVKFYMPERADFIESDIAFYLLVTNVKEDSLAEKAGLRKLDRIVGIDEASVEENGEKIPSNKLLELLAAAAAEKNSAIQIRRANEAEKLELETVTLNTGPKTFYMDSIKKWMSLVPQEQTKENKTKIIVYIILLMGVVTIVRCIAKFYQGYMAQKVVQVGINRLRQDAFDHVMDMPISYFANERPSDIVSRLIGDTGLMGKAIKIMLGKALREPLNALFMIIAAMILNWQLTLIFLGGAPLVLGTVALFGKKMKRATMKSLMVWSQMLAKMQQAVGNLKVVKVYNRQEHEHTSFKEINKRLLKQLLKISRVDAATGPVMEVLGMAAGSLALVVGAHWVIVQEQMDGTEFLTLLILLGASAEAIRKTSDIWNKIQEANAASERIFAIIDEPPEAEKANAVELHPLREKIEFRNVYFTYPGSERPVLNGINLTVKAGCNVAIVGPNGSGKTTLVNLLPRFYNPDSGSILIDGQDISDVTLASLRDQIGMVTQSVVTFNDTIASNIGYGKKNATLTEIIAAARRSFAHEFIEPLPEEYATVIGEYGAGLSGGQLQRIVIARAILKNPAILIFDEATSQVDADSEAKIHTAIEEIMQQRTSFIIAHRFSTVVTADVIVVMDKGQIIAQGQHEELIGNCTLYQSLYETQLIKA